MKISVGIDGGKDGGIVILSDNELILKAITPTIGNQIDLWKIRGILVAYDPTITHVVIENVHATYGASAKPTFNFGWSLGILEGLMAGMGIAFTKVASKEWQKEMW